MNSNKHGRLPELRELVSLLYDQVEFGLSLLSSQSSKYCRRPGQLAGSARTLDYPLLQKQCVLKISERQEARICTSRVCARNAPYTTLGARIRIS